MNRFDHPTASGFSGHRREESVPPSPSREPPPFTSHDPPDPAPQAAAWERALRVVFMESRQGNEGGSKNVAWRSNKRGRAAFKTPRRH